MPNPVLANNIKSYRSKLGFSQQDVADYLSVQREIVSYYETNARDIPLADLNKISNLFGVELIELLEEDSSEKMANMAFAFRSVKFTAEDLQAIGRFRKIVKNYLKLKKKEEANGQS